MMASMQWGPKIETRKQRHQAADSEGFYKVTDFELASEEPIDLSSNFEVHGAVELSEAERQCLALGPKFMETPNLNVEDYVVEVELECVKSRMELVKREEVLKSAGVVSEETLRMYDKQDKDSRQIFDSEKGALQLSKQRVTDAKHNTRSYPPRLAKAEDEDNL